MPVGLFVFMISFVSSLEIINIVLPDPNIFLLTAASVADETAVNPNRIKKFLANGLNAFPIKVNPGFNNVPISPPKHPPD